MALAHSKYDFFQYYNDYQAQSPTFAQRQLLLEEHKETMPDQIVESYLCQDLLEIEKSDSQYLERKKAPVYYIEISPLKERAISLQKWRGIVEEVQKDCFKAKLINLTDIGFDEYAEISNDEITQEDTELIEPGAIFYWSIGYSHSSTGQRRRFSDIRFRRIPKWDQKDIEIAREKAQKISSLIGW